ncbi:MAG: zinc ribbon domain-containing protein [Desulfofustis sp.]|nr:zinc ribbon domain-containing protein [Desulfofustis sp.]
MPIYEFICNSCGTEFEAIVSSTDTTSVTCDSCLSSDVKKVMSASSIVRGGSSSPIAPPASAGCGRSGFS